MQGTLLSVTWQPEREGICGEKGCVWAPLVVLVVKNLPGSAADRGDLSAMPGSGRAPEKERTTPPVFFPGEARGQRSLVGLQAIASQRVGHSCSDLAHLARMHVCVWLSLFAVHLKLSRHC